MWHPPSKMDRVCGEKVRIYDAGKEKFPHDHITVVFYGKSWRNGDMRRRLPCLGIAAGNYGNFSECDSGPCCGKRVMWKDLDSQIKRAIESRLKDVE